jgi:AcrR family transcriptional regulator
MPSKGMARTPAKSDGTLSLRDARAAFARRHICDAARTLFCRQGYGATTFEQIAMAAGTRRTTLYSHFADKAGILEAIAEEYHAALAAMVDHLPGPTPTHAEIVAWIAALVGFVESELEAATLLIGLGVGHDTPPVVEELSSQFSTALCRRIPAFDRVLSTAPPDIPGRAQAKVILRELSLGCLEAARGEAEGRAVLEIVAGMFEAFVQGQQVPLPAKG